MSKEKQPLHPGEILLREFIEPKEIQLHRLAKDLGWSFQELERLINGEASVTVDSAIELSEVLDVNPDFWLSLQKTWDDWFNNKSIDSDFEYEDPE